MPITEAALNGIRDNGHRWKNQSGDTKRGLG